MNSLDCRLTSEEKVILKGKNILVTGGGSGIGRATCLLASREGAHVAIADINLDSARETESLIKEEGGEAFSVYVDTSLKAEVCAMTEKVMSKFNEIDGLVCCAIKLVPGKLEELPEEDWDMVMNIGLKGYFLCAQSVGRTMLSQEKGSIVFVSSIGGMQTYPFAGAYSVCKAGVIMLAKLFGVEWANRGIRANALSPGQVITPMTQSMFDNPEIAAGRASVVPMGRVAKPEEIAEGCIFLLSDRSEFITGINLPIDGGQVESKMMHTPGRMWGGKKLK